LTKAQQLLEEAKEEARKQKSFVEEVPLPKDPLAKKP
jgi:hypothetical protein